MTTHSAEVRAARLSLPVVAPTAAGGSGVRSAGLELGDLVNQPAKVGNLLLLPLALAHEVHTLGLPKKKGKNEETDIEKQKDSASSLNSFIHRDALGTRM